MNPAPEPGPESLIAEQDWMRPLVQRLVRDEASAQDLLQSTWLRALRHPPRAEQGSSSWKSWFVRVARNLARREGQRDGARREREQRIARGERLPSMLEISEREELRARIVAHVLALPEPYRSTLVLRYYEGLEPRAIARAQNASGSTVRNRIARGLELLRERLEREQGKDWVAGCLSVLPIASAQLLVAQAGWLGWIAKGGVVAKKIEIATAAAVVLAAGAVWIAWPSQHGPEAPLQTGGAEVALSSEPAAVALPQSGATALEDAEALAGARADAQQRQPAGATELAAAGAGVRVFGRVRDAHGEPIQNSGGTFRMQLAQGSILSDVPVVDFYSAAPERPKAVEGVKLELVLQLDELRAHELTEPGDRTDAFKRVEMGTILNRLMLLGSTRIVFADSEGCQFTANTDTDSSYSVEGLHAGTWHTIVAHEGKLCRRQDFEIPAGEHQYALDITLDDALAVRVRLRTPDGRELTDAIAADPELGWRISLSPVALRPGSAARSLPDGENQPYGCGRYEPRAQLDESRRAAIGEASGVLTITEAPPLEVGLLASGQLVARRALASGEDLVEFELSLDDLRRLFSSVTVRVIDAATHLPIADAGVTIHGMRSLSEGPRGSQPGDDAQATLDLSAAERHAADDQPRTDSKGLVQIPWVLAGRHKLHVAAPGYAPYSGSAEIESGGTCELKPIELTGEARISGRLLGEQGGPLSLSFQLVPQDRFEETHESLDGRVWSSDLHGRFEVPGQRRERYVLRVVEGDSVLVPALVDASQGDVADIELRLTTARTVQIAYSREPREGAELRVTTSTGLPVLERDLAGLAPSELQLAPGAYTAEVREGTRRSGSVRFVVQRDSLRVLLGLD